MQTIKGQFDDNFLEVIEIFNDLLIKEELQGASLTVFQNKQEIINIYAGSKDLLTKEQWSDKTIVNIFSASKPIIAYCILDLLKQHNLSLTTKIFDDREISVFELLTHNAKLPFIKERLKAEDFYNKTKIHSLLAKQEQENFNNNAYHAFTFGFLSEIIIEKLSKQNATTYINNFYQNLGLDIFFGISGNNLENLAYTNRIKQVLDESSQNLNNAILHNKDSITHKVFTNPPSMLASVNKREFIASGLLAANAFTNAENLAKFYNLVLENKQMQKVHKSSFDKTLLTNTDFGLGVMGNTINTKHKIGLSNSSFGHPGSGGSLGFCDIEKQIAFAFTTNSLGSYVFSDIRVLKIIDSLQKCL